MLKEEPKYEEWLTTIVNTRLLYNTMEEFEAAMDNHSIHSNGIKRSFSSAQKMRSAFRDLKVEVALMTDNSLALDLVLTQYKEAWEFYKANLSRRSNPHEMALELLRYCYYPYQKEGLWKKKRLIFEQVEEKNISVTFLVLMLLKIIPGYDSKDGDVVNMAYQYEQAMQFLEEYTKGSTIYDVLPLITKSRGESLKTRLMLLHHVDCILETHNAYMTPEGIHDTSSTMKQKLVSLDLEGLWNECGGTADYTEFWQIEQASNIGASFATHWRKEADNTLTGIRYTLFTSEDEDGDIIFYIVHPEAQKDHMKGQKYTDKSHAWYKIPKPESDAPNYLPLLRNIKSSVWPPSIYLTKVTDNAVSELYGQWMDKCRIVKRFADCEYEFYSNLYAVTLDALYIPTEQEHEYYKIPKDAYEGFEKIQLGDNVGTLKMNGKVYLGFDEFLLYIPTSKSELKKYGITKVNQIE
ncbi:MAG: hypothetical protein K2J84_10505 [Bacteroidaceae bacterium]|nr:hypothetical protein [Bacteroidaceae bacterium]